MLVYVADMRTLKIVSSINSAREESQKIEGLAELDLDKNYQFWVRIVSKIIKWYTVGRKKLS